MTKRDYSYKNSQFSKDLWHFFRTYKGEFIFLSILLAIATSLSLINPIIIAKIIDYFTEGNSDLSIFYMYLGFLLGIGIIDVVLRHIAKYFLNIFTAKIQRKAKVETFQKLLQGDLVWHEKENTGNKIQKIVSGERAIGDFMNFYMNQGVNIVISLIGIFAIFIFFDIKYALIAAAYIALYLFAEFKLNKRLTSTTKVLKKAKESASGKAYEYSANIGTVKSLGIENASNKQIAFKEKKVMEAKNKRKKASAIKWVTVQIIATFFFSLFIFLVGRDIIIGALSIGSLVIYVDYVRRIGYVLGVISGFSNTLIDVKYSIYRMMKIHQKVPDIKEDNVSDLKKWNKIDIKNLKFKYKNEPVIEDMSLNIKKGEKIGIVGKSGSGKSTLFKLLLKLYLPKKGDILFDGKPITEISRDSIINKISVVPQETEVFNLSLKDNITISGSGRVDYNKYHSALKVSQTLPFIKKLKDKDLTKIGEKGIRLSGGEKQRLGIARALYKGSELIIFDEATSNLDYETERNLQNELDKIPGKTLIISAHRLSTLKNMDKILVIEKGRITEQGTYQELINKKGRFYKLLNKQKTTKK